MLGVELDGCPHEFERCALGVDDAEDDGYDDDDDEDNNNSNNSNNNFDYDDDDSQTQEHSACLVQSSFARRVRFSVRLQRAPTTANASDRTRANGRARWRRGCRLGLAQDQRQPASNNDAVRRAFLCITHDHTTRHLPQEPADSWEPIRHIHHHRPIAAVVIVISISQQFSPSLLADPFVA
ncbi:uncharacterized protein PV09_06453 [Verruconis gallopava]|uniref:Uncharacterized protein n=1 Tax=Verruconis gallopava TaxID=253628 RepID=A0A0D1XJ31_9PEZI|nr:uncharacterized protein PV09_06453 [Verruconis gallopava]KIW02306.1 hypothetical protein PV09_06453 [Verruconis gallopava]